MEDRINAGFRIIKSIKLDAEEFVLGEKIKGSIEYVTWYCPSPTDYYFGHYLTDKNKALLDLYERAAFELKYKVDTLKEVMKNEEN